MYELCASWGLPVLPNGKSSVSESPSYTKSQPHWPETELEHDNDKVWTGGSERFVFIMDSQVVQRVICGHSALTNDKYRAVFHRIMDRLVRMLNHNVKPPLDIADPVQWQPRDFNARADWLCNRALDTKTSFSYIDESVHTHRSESTQWEAFSDGGCRGDGHSAFAWIIYANLELGVRQHRFTIAYGYECVKGIF